jgi:hypothetical protein
LFIALNGPPRTNGPIPDPYERELDLEPLDGCRRLTLLRLACIHAEPALAGLAARPGRPIS